MDNRQTALLRQLLDTPSPSGFEGKVQEIFHREVSAFCPEVNQDVHGSVIARLPGISPRKIVLAGHADEIGLIVRYIDDDGFLYFNSIGGVDPHVLPGQRVRLMNPQGDVPGVIGRTAVHLRKMEEGKEDKEKLQLHDLWIDIGARDRQQAARLAPVGTPAVWGEGFALLCGNRAAARDFDDKAGVYVVIETLRLLAARSTPPPLTVIGISSAQEETGVFSAGPAAYGLDPQAAIAIDVTHATDSPGIEKKRFGEVHLGSGPVIHRGVKSSKILSRALEEAAERRSISYQIGAESGSFGTDADSIAVRRSGIPVNTLSIPLRYMHSSSEVASLDDVDAVVDLLAETLSSLDPEIDLRPFAFAKK